MQLGESFFARKFNLTERDLDRYLGEALSAGGDYADLYFEYLITTSIVVDESIVKSATQGTTLGRRHPRHRGRAHRVRLQRRPQPGEDS